jgi:hypothetical protein
MRNCRRRRYRIELWRVIARIEDGIETPESMSRLAERRAWLEEKLGTDMPVGAVDLLQPT